MIADELPEKLFRTSSGAVVVHVTDDCDTVNKSNAKGNGRWIDTEYLRRAPTIRLCKVCADGLTFGGVK